MTENGVELTADLLLRTISRINGRKASYHPMMSGYSLEQLRLQALRILEAEKINKSRV